jgi:hypothetical protein
MIDLSHLTEQQIVDQVVKGLASQGFEQSLGAFQHPDHPWAKEVCLYRQGTKRCAAGWLIPDEQYDPKFDDALASGNWNKLVALGWASMTHQSLISHLQYCHDRGTRPEDMKSRLQATILEHKLALPPELR